MNIYQKMSAITAEITAVAKNLNVGWGQNSYKAVGEADVLATVKPIEEKYGVYSYPVNRHIMDTSVLTSVNSKGNEVRQLFMRIETTYRFVNAEMPEEYIDIKTYGDGVDSQDKAPGKAMTYADKYALLKAYKIITGDDPDQECSKELKGKAAKPAKSCKSEATVRQLESKESGEQSKNTSNELLSSAERSAIESRCKEDGVDADKLLSLYSLSSFEKMKYKHYDNILKNWEKVKEKCGGAK